MAKAWIRRKLAPNTDDQAGSRGRGKCRSSGQPGKIARLDIHAEHTVPPSDVAQGSRFLSHRALTVQNLKAAPTTSASCSNGGQPWMAGC